MDQKNIQDIYKLSPTQHGLLFNTLYASGAGLFIEQAVWPVSDLDVPGYVRAWQTVVERHAILRTAFFWQELDEPLQVVARRVDLAVAQEDWRGLDRARQQARLRAFLEADRRRGFDLSAAPLMRLAVLRRDEANHDVVWSYHHILLDGWSVVLLIQEVQTCYQAFREGQSIDLPPPRPFRDYVAWLQKKDWQTETAFWQQKLDGFVAATALSVDRAPGSLPSPQVTFGQQEIGLPAATTSTLQAFARQQRVTVNTLVHAAWTLLLNRYSGQEDVTFGVTVHGRPVEISGFETMVGLFINAIPVRVLVPPDRSVADWLSALRAEFAALLRYSYSPLVQIQTWNGIARNKPMFDYVLVDQSHQSQTQSSTIHELFEITGYPLTLYIALSDTLLLRISYDQQRFDEDAIGRLLQHLQTLLLGIVADPRRLLSEIPILTESERHQLLVEWNSTQADYPAGQCVHDLLAAQASRTPDAVATVFQDQQLTYHVLDRRANQLAHHLQTLGVRPETRVGIHLERSPEIVIALLGVLKAGGAYLPLDPAYPPERLAFMLADAQASVLLTQKPLAEHLPTHRAQTLCLDADGPTIAQQPASQPHNDAAVDNLAYLIYTSGSTGQPKGVIVTQQSLAQYVLTARDYLALTSSDNVLQFASLSFDAAVEEIYPCLLSGARLVLRTDAMLDAVETFLDDLAAQGVNVSILPTAYWHTVVAELEADSLTFPPTLRLIDFGGEAASPERLKTWHARAPAGIRLLNTYGPTEATVVATVCDLAGENAVACAALVPIGKPIANVQAYVLDAHRQPLPIGVPGELYIGGGGLARGYLDRPQRTAEAFVPHPFSDEPGARLYRSGDLARYLPDGNLEFQGRLDDQVKVRGYRIELGEVEAVLSQHPAVSQAAVVASQDGPGGKRLVAYLAPGDVQLQDLRDFMRQRLPDYMIPAVFVPLDALPLTPSGKVNRRALPAPDSSLLESREKFVPPETTLEKKLADIWIQVLQVERVGILDNFFELGGDSLSGTQIISRIRRALRVNVPMHALLQEPTIAHLALLIEEILLAELEAASPHGQG